jgi:putative ABC transport system permease protein
VTFAGLVLHNLGTRRLRTALTAVAVAISVMAVVTLAVVTTSLETSAADILSLGKADFIVAEKGVSTALSSSVTDDQVSRIASTAGVQSAVGVLVSEIRLNATNPLFLQIGVEPQQLAAFGVHLVSGRAYTAHARDELMLGWQAAQNLDKHVGSQLRVGTLTYTVVGIFSLSQEPFANSAAMFPLTALQANTRKPGLVTLAAVKVAPGSPVVTVEHRIQAANPSLATVRLATQFGRIDSNLSYLDAAQTGAKIIALVIGVIVVMNAMLLSFVERIREFGVLRAVGWSRSRLLSLVLSEALLISLLGAAVGVAVSFGLTAALQHFSSLRGVLHIRYTTGVFWTALYTAVAIGLVAASYPSLRAAMLRPGVALRRE